MECFDWSDDSFSSTNIMLYVSQRDEMAVKCRTLAMLKAVEQEDPECYYNNLDDNTYTYNWAWDLLDDCNQNIYWTFFLDLCRDNITRITGPPADYDACIVLYLDDTSTPDTSPCANTPCCGSTPYDP